jgi:hypothetical protein
VISGLTGKADRLIDSFARNETERHRSAPGRSKRSGSGRRESRTS